VQRRPVLAGAKNDEARRADQLGVILGIGVTELRHGHGFDQPLDDKAGGAERLGDGRERPAVHAEAGCIEYAPAIDAEGAGANQTKLGPDSFVVIEKWASLDALKAHAASPHMAAYAAKTRELVASRVIHVLSPG
jgi:quinol monooxygenase YgiN